MSKGFTIFAKRSQKNRNNNSRMANKYAYFASGISVSKTHLKKLKKQGLY